MDLGLIFGQKSSNYKPKNPPLDSLVGFADSNFTKDPKDRKSVI